MVNLYLCLSALSIFLVVLETESLYSLDCCTVEKLVKMNLLGAKVAEVPFTLRYDKKRGDSKMSLNVTTFGYFVMLILYHWPFNGWRVTARAKLSSKNDSKS